VDEPRLEKIMNYETAMKILNAAAGFDTYGWNGREMVGVTIGYIGSVHPWGDDRTWGVFRPNASSLDRMKGRFSTEAELYADLEANIESYKAWVSEGRNAA